LQILNQAADISTDAVLRSSGAGHIVGWRTTGCRPWLLISGPAGAYQYKPLQQWEKAFYSILNALIAKKRMKDTLSSVIGLAS